MDGSSPFVWVGNHPATDLCNTTPVIDGRRVELLDDTGALTRWLLSARVGTNVGLDQLSPAEQRATIAYTHAIRDGLRAILEATPSPTALARLNDVLAANTPVLHVSPPARGVDLVAASPAAQLRLDLTLAVIDILRHDRRRVRRCANPACVLLFLDTSKSARRRWCDMSTCGNRAKAAAHHRRRHGAS
jgi:predicted RNA-binding Zn ribbon-like protein